MTKTYCLMSLVLLIGQNPMNDFLFQLNRCLGQFSLKSTMSVYPFDVLLDKMSKSRRNCLDKICPREVPMEIRLSRGAQPNQ